MATRFAAPTTEGGIRLQQQLAQQLMAQGSAGVPASWDRMPVTPKYTAAQGLGQMAQMLSGGLLAQKADQAGEALKVKNSQALAEALARGPDAPVAPGSEVAPAMNIMGQDYGAVTAPDVDTQQRSSAMRYAASLMDKGPMGQAIGQQLMMQTAMPKAPEEYTLAPGEKRFRGGKEIASAAPTPDKGPSDWQEYQKAKAEGFPGGFLDYQLQMKRAGAPSVSTTVNTEKGLYGGLAGKMADQYATQFENAQKAPDLIARAQRVKGLLNDTKAITGAGADFLLAGSKIAAQLGFNTGDAAADTEMLSRELASSTLDAIKASGLGAGSGFSNADRDFLEKAVGGKITMEGKTLARLADLNEKAARATVQRWNSSADRLDPEQLRTMGLQKVWLEPEASGGPKRISSDAEYDALPKGAEYIAPDGSRRTKR